MTKSITKNILTAIVIAMIMAPIIQGSVQFKPAQAQPTQPTGVTSIDATVDFPDPQISAVQKSAMISKAVNVPGIKDWSPNGWEFLTMNFYGTTEPTMKWGKAVMYLKLPVGKGDPKAACENGWTATVTFDLNTNEIIETGFPTMSLHDCQSGLELGGDHDRIAGPAKVSVDIPSFVPSASAATLHVDALESLENDVVSSNLHGAWVNVKTPTVSSTVFNTGHMEYFVSNTLNQKFVHSTGDPDAYFLQGGWVVSKIASCTSCGSEMIPANSKDLVYVDKNAFGNYDAHKIAITYVDNSFAQVQIYCGISDTNYKIRVVHNGVAFSHPTTIPCTTTNNHSSISNSLYFENGNTVSSSNWAGDLTQSQMGASNAKKFITQSTQADWSSMGTDEKDCHGSRTANTPLITGTLASAGTMGYTNLSQIGLACIF